MFNIGELDRTSYVKNQVCESNGGHMSYWQWRT